MPHQLPIYSAEIRKKAKQAVLVAAHWHEKVQIRHQWPDWTADCGRFIGSQGVKTVSKYKWPSICWNTGRGSQALLSAYCLSGDKTILTSAQLAIEYVKTCQIFSPEYSHHSGACFEETPQTDHIAARDTVEAIQSFLNLYAVTGDRVALQRAEAGLSWFTGWYLANGWPNGYIWLKKNDAGSVNNDFSRLMLSAVALAFAQYDALTGQKKYSKFIPQVMDWVIDNCLEKDGALKMHDGTDVGHHAVLSGPLADCFTNDDGVGIAMIACYQATKNEKYKEAALRNGEWWLRMPVLPDTHASIPAGLLFLLDLYRFTGDKRYLVKSEPYIEETLKLQYLSSADPNLHGGFLGLDFTGKKEGDCFPEGSMGYISHRTTMYAMLALSKVAAENEKEWNIAYSAFGWGN